MKVLITGANGLLGHDVIRVLEEKNIDYLPTDLAEMDITDKEKVLQIITEYAPDIVIHCAAFTAVDKAEEEPDLCYRINTQGTKNVAEACAEFNCKLVFISTDYVFSGRKDGLYEVTDKRDPISVYGKSKSQAEEFVEQLVEKHFIIRTSWSFGTDGANFVKSILKLAQERETIQVVNDQIGSPTYTYDLAHSILEIMETEFYGIYHVVNQGYCSFYEYAKKTYQLRNIKTKIIPVSSNEYPQKAERPKNSKFSSESLKKRNFSLLPSWEDALHRFLATL